MIDFLLLSENLPFAVALSLLALLALIECLGLLIGAGVSDSLEAMLPDVDLDLEVDAPSSFGHFLSWLGLGKVPTIILLVVLLASFSFSGIVIQKSALTFNGSLISPWVAAGLSFIVSLPIVRYVGQLLAMILPSDETNSVSRTTYIQSKAKISLGVAKQNYPAQARLTDQYGQAHYVMVEPNSDVEISAGAWVRILDEKQGVFLVEPCDAD